MKKKIIFAISLILSLTIVACGSEDKKTETATIKNANNQQEIDSVEESLMGNSEGQTADTEEIQSTTLAESATDDTSLDEGESKETATTEIAEEKTTAKQEKTTQNKQTTTKVEQTTTKQETTTQKETTTKQETTTQKETTTKAETTTQKETTTKAEVTTTTAAVEQEVTTTAPVEGVHWKLEGDTLTIYGNGWMEDYEWSDDVGAKTPWRNNKSDIKKVIVEEGVKSIGSHAFTDCVNLESVSIPSTVQYIFDSAFLRCTSLTSITIPEGVKQIGTMAFTGCENLANVNLPTSLECIWDYAFYECYSLKSIVIPDSVYWIEQYCFYNCNGLESIVLSSSLTEITYSVFDGCTSLRKIEIPASITVIRPRTFYRCSNVTVYGESGSYAQQWAEEQGFAFEEK